MNMKYDSGIVMSHWNEEEGTITNHRNSHFEKHPLETGLPQELTSRVSTSSESWSLRRVTNVGGTYTCLWGKMSHFLKCRIK